MSHGKVEGNQQPPVTGWAIYGGDIHAKGGNSTGKTFSGDTLGRAGGQNVDVLDGDGMHVTAHTTGGANEWGQSIDIKAGSRGWFGGQHDIKLQNGQVLLDGETARQGRTPLGNGAFLDVNGSDAKVTTYNRDGSIRGQWTSNFSGGGTATGHYDSSFYGETKGLTGQLGNAIRTGHFDGNDNHFRAGGNGWSYNAGWGHRGNWGHEASWHHQENWWDRA
jgi:hypothetical protein